MSVRTARVWIYCVAHYLEVAFFFVHLGLLKEIESGCVCEMRYFGFARDLVNDLSHDDVCSSSRHLCSCVVHVSVGYVHWGENPCPCPVLATSACGCSCVCDLVHVHYLVSLTARDVSVYSACAPSLAQTRPRWGSSSNRCPRLSNVIVTIPYLWPSLYPIRLSHTRPASCAASTVLQR